MQLPSTSFITPQELTIFLFSSAFQALMKRNTDLTPSQTEQTAITNLVNKIQAVLDGLIVSPGNFDACVSLASQLLHVLALLFAYGQSSHGVATPIRYTPSLGMFCLYGKVMTCSSPRPLA